MRFDRQVLYLVFLFGSAHAAPAQTFPTTTASNSTATPSLNDPPSLRLDISPQLISSVADFASQVVSAVVASESSSSSSRSSTTHLLCDESTFSESCRPPIALQTTRIAAPSDPKNPAVTSSTSTPRRSRTRVLSTPGTAPVSTSSISARPTTTTPERPYSSFSHTSEHQDTTLHQATRSHPANTHAVSAGPFHNSTRLNSSMDQDSEPANMTGATNTADGIGGLLTAIGQVGALSGSSLVSGTETDAPTPTNALDVLISALPSSIATSIQSEFSEVIDPIGSGIDSLTSDVFGVGERTSRTQSQTPRTTSTSISSTTTTSPTTTPTSLPPPTTTNGNPMSTMVTRPSDTDSSPAGATTTTAPVSSSNPSENASTIGIATGVASGVVLLCLGGLYLWRRRQQGKAPFARSSSKRSNGVYPEVAWLYDPDITPPRSRAGSGSGQHLIPEPRPGSVETGGTPVMGGRSPEMRPANPSSPLLAPVVRGSRDMVGSRSRSGSEVDIERLRPLSTLREESLSGSR